MHLINQDKDRIYKFDPTATFYTMPIFDGNIYMGINLMMGAMFLGTFDSPQEAVDEISRIYNHKGEIYTVSGYSEGMEDDCC